MVQVLEDEDVAHVISILECFFFKNTPKDVC